MKAFKLRFIVVAVVCLALGLVGGLLKSENGNPEVSSAQSQNGSPTRLTAIGDGRRATPAPSLLSDGQSVSMSAEQFDAFIEQNKYLQILIGGKLDGDRLALLGIDREAVGELQKSVDRIIGEFQKEDVARRELILDDAGEIQKIVVPAYPERSKVIVSELRDDVGRVIGEEQAATLMPLFHRGLEQLTSNEGTTRREFELVPMGDRRFALHVTIDGVGPRGSTSVPGKWRHIVDIIVDQ